jgi:cysteine desulfurase
LEHTSIEEIKRSIPRGSEYELPNDTLGCIKLDVLEQTLREIHHKYKGKPFVSVSFANSEIGVIQDIKSISKIVHKYNGILHVDATQMYPWGKIDVQDLGIDLMSVSGQKMHCVKGIGFLYIRNGIALKPSIYGSQQEGRRGGTMPTHLIAAFGKALEITRRKNAANSILSDFRDTLLYSLMKIDGVHLNGPLDSRLPNNISVTIDGVNASSLATMCDLMGVIIAKGAACKSYEPKPSETLLAIGLTPEQALNTIRISLGYLTTMREVREATEIITQLVARIREENSQNY